jgi:DNA-binding NtrC family response regulator
MKKPDPPVRGKARKNVLTSATLEAEREAIIRALERHHGNITHVAKDLGVVRSQMTRLVDRHELREFAKKLRAAVPGASPTGRGRQYTPE